jgi:hypothetical protein
LWLLCGRSWSSGSLRRPQGRYWGILCHPPAFLCHLAVAARAVWSPWALLRWSARAFLGHLGPISAFLGHLAGDRKSALGRLRHLCRARNSGLGPSWADLGFLVPSWGLLAVAAGAFLCHLRQNSASLCQLAAAAKALLSYWGFLATAAITLLISWGPLANAAKAF